MRKLVFYLVLILNQSTSFGQKTFSSRAGDYTWVYHSTTWANIDANYAENISIDSFQFNGKYYRKFQNLYFREAGQILYGLKQDIMTEYVIMDLGLNIGDTLISQGNSDQGEIILLEKAKIKIGQDSLLKLKFRIYKPNSQGNLIWIESIGSFNFYPLDWTKILGFADIGYYNTCILKNDTNILTGLHYFENNLLNPNKKWYYWASDHNGDLKYGIQYYRKKDTVLNSKTYQYMNYPRCYARYDSTSGKYYLKSNLNEETLMFNERAKVGDTIAVNGGYSYQIVSKIDYQFIENVYRKVFYTQNDSFYSGIGCINCPMWLGKMPIFPEFQLGSLCYSEFNQVKYHFPDYYILKTCDVGSSISESNDEIKLYFSENKLYIYSHNSILKNAQLKIFNLSGQAVLSKSISNSSQLTFDLSSFINGLYFAKLETSKAIYRYKIQKE